MNQAIHYKYHLNHLWPDIDSSKNNENSEVIPKCHKKLMIILSLKSNVLPRPNPGVAKRLWDEMAKIIDVNN